MGKKQGKITDLTAEHLLQFYKALDDHFGNLHWWPGDSTLEIVIGAVLTQNTAWRNVERAIDNLKQSGLIHMGRMLKTERVVLETILRPAGFFRIKTERLTNLLQFIQDEYAGDFDRMFAEELWPLRKKLLTVRGIGPETADCILLYGGGKPVFVWMPIPGEFSKRHGLTRGDEVYEGIQGLFMDHLTHDGVLFGQYHALLVEVGKVFCKKIPRCGPCPLGCFLTDSP